MCLSIQKHSTNRKIALRVTSATLCSRAIWAPKCAVKEDPPRHRETQAGRVREEWIMNLRLWMQSIAVAGIGLAAVSAPRAFGVEAASGPGQQPVAAANDEQAAAAEELSIGVNPRVGSIWQE